VIGGHRRNRDQPGIGHKRENNADENEKLPGGQDLVLRDQAHKAVHPLARPDNQHHRDGHADGGLRQGDRSEGVDEEVRYRDDQGPAGTRSQRLFVPEKGV
jgi:hypothetical protein